MKKRILNVLLTLIVVLNGFANEILPCGSSKITAIETGSLTSIPVTGVSLNPASLLVKMGIPYQLSPVLLPSECTNTTVTYSSNKPSVATVSATGLVSGVSPGSVIITLTTEDGGFKAYFTATIHTHNLILPAVISNNMVMQQNTLANLWGWGPPSESVNISASWGQKVTAIADATGKWSVKIQTPSAIQGLTQTKHTLVFTGKNNTLLLTNILIGDVYLCSGQSNMAFSMSPTSGTLGVLNYAAEVAAASYPNIRINKPNQNPQYVETENNPGVWYECSPSSIASFPAIPYLFARNLYTNSAINIPIGVLVPAVGGSSCQSWTQREALAADPILKSTILDEFDKAPSLTYQTASTVLYNGMLLPLAPFSLKAILWYQGEANSRTGTYPDLYAKLNGTMIKNWRDLWGQGDVPFYYVQLPAYVYSSPEFRDQQSTILKVSNTAMAVCLDLADADLANIHPRNKQEVAKRLARIAEAKLYGQNINYAGPLYKSMKVEGPNIRISFHPASIISGLASRDGQTLNNFQIAGSNGTFYAADAVIDGNDILVSSTSVPTPTNVAFAYTATAVPNLMNKDSLTACPFRTDKWDAAISMDPIVLNYLEKSATEIGISIFPVPATDMLNIRFTKPMSEGHIELVTIAGKALYKSNCDANVLEEKIDLAGFPKGAYIVRINGNNLNFNRTILIQ